MAEEGIPDGEIVGLHGTTNGRSCVLHDVCGSMLQVNSLVRFKWCRVKIRGVGEGAIKAVSVCFGRESCTVGFLPKSIALQPGAREMYHDKFATIVYLLDESDNIDVLAESRRSLGKAYFLLLNNVPSLE